MRPRGPLPPRVYWTRRVLLGGVLLVAVALVWWLMPGGSGSGAASADPGGTTRTPQHPVTTETHQSPKGSAKGATSAPPTTPRSPSHSTHQAPTTPVHSSTPPPPAVPTGRCDPTNITLTVDVNTAIQGKGTRVGLRMATKDGTTCSLGVMPSKLEIKITSTPATIWQSTTCPDGLPAKNVVVGPRPAVVYSIHWDGHIDPNACRTGWRVADPGGYWATAALIGGEPHTAYFAVVAAQDGT